MVFTKEPILDHENQEFIGVNLTWSTHKYCKEAIQIPLMAIYNPANPTKIQISYTRDEVHQYRLLESELMSELHISTRSGLHKAAIRHLARTHKQNQNLKSFIL